MLSGSIEYFCGVFSFWLPEQLAVINIVKLWIWVVSEGVSELKFKVTSEMFQPFCDLNVVQLYHINYFQKVIELLYSV